MEYDNTNRGVLFKNERKTHDKQPDYTGTIIQVLSTSMGRALTLRAGQG